MDPGGWPSLRTRSWQVRAGLALAASAGAVPVAAQARKLSPDYALRPAGTVARVQPSPDGSRAVYLATSTSGSFPREGRLFSVPVDGRAAPTLLSRPMIASGDVHDFGISPDSGWVLYLADQEVEAQNELFSTRLDGSVGTVKLSPALAPGEAAHLGGISPDSARVVFLVRRSGPALELYSSPIDGSAPALRLNAPLPAGGTVLGGPISPDGSRVVYTAEQDADGVVELFVVPIDASAAPLKLSGTLVAGGDVFPQAPVITPDGARVVYLADAQVDGTYELFSVPIDGSAPPVRLSGTVGPGQVQSFRVSPDSARVVYRANPRSIFVDDLFSVPVDGSTTPVRIDDDASADLLEFAITADSSAVLWTKGLALFRAPIASSASVQVLNGTTLVAQFSLQPAGTRAVFLEEPPLPGEPAELYSVPVDGSAAPVRVNGPLVPGGTVPRGAAYTPDGATALYYAEQELLGRADLYSAPVAGLGPSLKLATGNATESFSAIQATASAALFLEDHAWPGVHELHGVPLSGAWGPIQLSQLPRNRAEGDIAAFALSPDLRWAVYRGDQEQVGRFALHAVRTDGSARPRRLAPPLGPDQDVEPDFRVAPGSRRVLYRSDANGDEVFELFSVPIGGGTGRVVLHAPPVAGGDVVEFALARSTGAVAFLADGRVDETFELFATLADGSTSPVRVIPGLVAGGDVRPGFRFGPGGTRLLYLADQDTDETVELYRTDPAGVPQKLSAPLVPGGDVVDFATAPRGLRVVYLADQAADERFELFVTTGSTAPVGLSPSPTQPLRDVERDFRFSPDGQWVLFRADSATDEQVELWRAPAGGGTALRMNGSLVGPGDVTEFQMGPDGVRVAYLADQSLNGAFALYSRPLDRSTAAVLLSEPPSPSVPVVEFAFSPDSEWLAYARQGASTRQVSLVRADGSAPPIALPYAPANQHGAFRFTPDGASLVVEGGGLFLVPIDSPLQPRTLGGGTGHPFAVTHRDVVLLGDLEIVGAIELFATPLARAIQGASPPP